MPGRRTGLHVSRRRPNHNCLEVRQRHYLLQTQTVSQGPVTTPQHRGPTFADVRGAALYLKQRRPSSRYGPTLVDNGSPRRRAYTGDFDVPAHIISTSLGSAHRVDCQAAILQAPSPAMHCPSVDDRNHDVCAVPRLPTATASVRQATSDRGLDSLSRGLDVLRVSTRDV